MRQGFSVPGELYQRIKDQPVRLEIQYPLTLFRLTSLQTLPANNGDRRISGLGHCATRINAAETAVQLRYVQAGDRPGCVMFRLQDAPPREFGERTTLPSPGNSFPIPCGASTPQFLLDAPPTSGNRKPWFVCTSPSITSRERSLFPSSV